ncbi:MAG TPA: hypothetical protein VK582_25990 [Pyrinomonadaceae bacterium]|nr:hypothetical protein [Pyrinomonadaceae bacterium]
MTPDQHNKYLGFAHLAYAVLHSLMGAFIGIMMIVMFSALPPTRPGNPPPPAFFVGMAVFMVAFTLIWSIPSMIAAYALLKKKRWAKTASIVAGVFAATQIPVGTAVGIYSFWFAFGEPGRLLYDQPAKSLLSQQPADGARINQEKAHEYFPPAKPPDWR